MWVQSLGREDPLMKDKATLSSTQSERSTPLLVSSKQPSWQSGYDSTLFLQSPQQQLGKESERLEGAGPTATLGPGLQYGAFSVSL